jgi:hypothetical protein
MDNIREWYKDKYPSDDMGNDIYFEATFKGLVNNITNVYDYIYVFDSLVRERVFEELSNRLDIPYDSVYNIWLSQ